MVHWLEDLTAPGSIGYLHDFLAEEFPYITTLLRVRTSDSTKPEKAGKESTNFASALLAVMARSQSYYYLLVIVIHCTVVSICSYLRPLLPL